jgi:hypothetical protein
VALDLDDRDRYLVFRAMEKRLGRRRQHRQQWCGSNGAAE